MKSKAASLNLSDLLQLGVSNCCTGTWNGGMENRMEHGMEQ